MKTKKFDPSRAQLLDAESRLQWNNPEQLVAQADIPEGARVAEIGCGSGWFTFALEKTVRPRGMVYALDMQPAMLQILHTKRQNWERILTLPCGENTFELDDGEVDVVFHANVLHECAQPLKHLQEIKRVLKDQGHLVVIDWRKTDDADQPGPPKEERLDTPDAERLLQESGFSVDSLEEVGPYHYMIKATKQ